MTEHEYTAKIGQDLLNKLSDSLKQGKWRPHKTLLNYLGIPLEDIQRRTRLFHQSFTVKDPAFPRAYMFVKIVHNKQEVEILFKYKDRVGRTRKGAKVDRTFARYPECSLKQITDLYDECKNDFIRGVNYFAKIRQRSIVRDQIQQHYERFLQDRLALVKAEKLSHLTTKSQIGRWHNHIKKICLDDDGYEPFRKLEIRKVRRADIKRLIKKLNTTKAIDERKHVTYTRGSAVINAIVADLKTFFEWCEDEELRDELTNPIYRIEKEEIEPRDKTLTYKQLGTFMSYFMNNFVRTSDRVRVAVYLLWKTAQRVNEVLSLKWEDIVIDEVGETKQQLLMFKNKKSKKKNKHKGHNVWFMPLDDELMMLFKNLPRLNGNPYIFWTDRDRVDGERYISSAVLNDAIKKCCAELGMEKFSPHDIKRSVVTNDMFKYGEDAVKITTGNKDGRVLREHYVHAIKNNRIQDNLYEQSKAIQEQRSAEIREHFEVPVSRAKVLNLIPKQQVRNLPKNTLNQRYSKLRDKIKRKYGVAPATYYRRKKEGYYD